MTRSCGVSERPSSMIDFSGACMRVSVLSMVDSGTVMLLQVLLVNHVACFNRAPACTTHKSIIVSEAALLVRSRTIGPSHEAFRESPPSLNFGVAVAAGAISALGGDEAEQGEDRYALALPIWL